MTQLTLIPDEESEETRRFREFHEANPQVYRALVRLARQAKVRGRKRIGVEPLVNVVRWETWLATDDPNTDFKLNSNYKPFYARLIMQQEEDLAGIFETRHMWANGDYEVAA